MSNQLVALILFAVVSTGSPGGATSLATASGAQFGFARTQPLIIGLATTLGLLVAFSGTGLSNLILAAPSLAIAMKIGGTAYLLWLAYIILKSGSPNNAKIADAKPIGFLGGVLLLLVNPKAWAMAIGVASSFSGLSPNPYFLAVILSFVFTTSCFLSLTIWCLAGSALARHLHKEWHWHVFNTVMAAMLAASVASLWI